MSGFLQILFNTQLIDGEDKITTEHLFSYMVEKFQILGDFTFTSFDVNGIASYGQINGGIIQNMDL